MLSLIKSKGFILFVAIVLGATILTTENNVKLERKSNLDENYISMNLQ